MANYKKGTTEFVNPYNFIPLGQVPDKNINVENKNEEQLYTGYFECSLEAKTPLAIPDVENKKEDKPCNGHFIYSTYKLGKTVAIPGSSLRGVIRSMYETMTNSCMVTMDPNEIITKRSDLGTFSPCVIKYEDNAAGTKEWRLYKANRIPLVGKVGKNEYKQIQGNYKTFNINRDKNNVKYLSIKDNDGKKTELFYGAEVKITSNGPNHEKKGREVWPSTVDNISKLEEKNGQVKHTNCFLFLGEKINNKHAESIFKAENKKEKYESEEIQKALMGLKETLEMYRSEAINRNLGKGHYGYKGFEHAEETGIIPLWYTEKNGKLYLSLAAIGRIAFFNTMGDIAKGYEPCKNRNQLCPACSVFGMVGSNSKERGLGSKIRITDAIITTPTEESVMEKITLKELGSPRISYLPFYSEEGRDYDDSAAKIKGRKYYWHISKVNSDTSIYTTTEKTKRNATLDLIATGQKFNFKVYYDRLTKKQLDLLTCSLDLSRFFNKESNKSSNDEGEFCYKIGHGKPLGLGSAKISITKHLERILNDEEYKIEEKDMDFSQISIENNEDLKKITRFGESSIEVRYPFVNKPEKNEGLKENELASHQWFKEFKNNKGCLPSIQYAFCKPLYCVEIDKKDVENDDKKNSSHFSKGNTLKKGRIYSGIVTGYNSSGKFATVKLDIGNSASFYDAKHQYEGKHVSLKYDGKDGRGFPKWIVQ